MMEENISFVFYYVKNPTRKNQSKHNKTNNNNINQNIKYIIIKCDLVAYPSIIHFYFQKQRNYI